MFKCNPWKGSYRNTTLKTESARIIKPGPCSIPALSVTVKALCAAPLLNCGFVPTGLVLATGRSYTCFSISWARLSKPCRTPAPLRTRNIDLPCGRFWCSQKRTSDCQFIYRLLFKPSKKRTVVDTCLWKKLTINHDLVLRTVLLRAVPMKSWPKSE